MTAPPLTRKECQRCHRCYDLLRNDRRRFTSDMECPWCFPEASYGARVPLERVWFYGGYRHNQPHLVELGVGDTLPQELMVVVPADPAALIASYEPGAERIPSLRNERYQLRHTQELAGQPPGADVHHRRGPGQDRNAMTELSQVPLPGRITIALGDRYGPEVDRALGGEEPMVDEWEEGKTSPTRRQVELLSEMTGYAVDYFYTPFTDAELNAVSFVCVRSGKGRGCKTTGPVRYPDPPALDVLF